MRLSRKQLRRLILNETRRLLSENAGLALAVQKDINAVGKEGQFISCTFPIPGVDRTIDDNMIGMGMRSHTGIYVANADKIKKAGKLTIRGKAYTDDLEDCSLTRQESAALLGVLRSPACQQRYEEVSLDGGRYFVKLVD